VNETARAGGFRGDILGSTSNQIFTVTGASFTVVIVTFVNASGVVDGNGRDGEKEVSATDIGLGASQIP
jgi:hypothetical protein